MSTDKLRKLKNEQTAALAAVTRKRHELTDYMTKEDMLHLVKEKFDEFNVYCKRYLNSHNVHIAELSSSEEQDLDETVHKETSRFEEKQNSIVLFRSTVMNWITQAENTLQDSVDSASGVTRSSRSSRSRRSKASSKSSNMRNFYAA